MTNPSTSALQRFRGRRAARRRGAATVEFAITASILFLLSMAALELSRMNLLRNTVENAAYEAARAAAIPGASSKDAKKAAKAVLNAVNAQGVRVTVDPDTITDSTEEVTVSIRVKMNKNGWVPPVFTRGLTIDKSVTLLRERRIADGALN